MPLNVIAGWISDDEEEFSAMFTNEHQYIKQLRENLETIYELARSALNESAVRQKTYYDKTVKHVNYETRYLVRRWQPQILKGAKRKLGRNWTGPWVI